MIEKSKFDPLGDGISCLEYIDHMGSDQSITRSARVSYGNDKKDFNKERDTKLIKYLIQHRHTTPLEHNAVTLHVALPIFLARQWRTHRVGTYLTEEFIDLPTDISDFSFNEISRRYTNEDIQFYIPKREEWRLQNKDGNKQGSSYDLESATQSFADVNIKSLCNEAISRYDDLIRNGVANEMARMILPVNLYTRWYMTANLHAIMHWHNLRSESHAQYEMQLYAKDLSVIMSQLFPVTWNIYLELKEGK